MKLLDSDHLAMDTSFLMERYLLWFYRLLALM